MSQKLPVDLSSHLTDDLRKPAVPGLEFPGNSAIWRNRIYLKLKEILS